MPPPLPLRSTMIHSIFCAVVVTISLFNKLSVSSPIIDIVIIPIDLPSTVCTSLDTDGIDIVSLVTVTSNISLVSSMAFTLSIVSTTCDPFGQRIRMTASPTVSFCVLSPSTARIRSSGRRPAWKAGDSFMISSMSM